VTSDLLNIKKDDDISGGGSEQAAQQSWKKWKVSGGTPDANHEFLTDMAPHITRAAKSQVSDVNPLVASKAKMIALNAADSYSPDKGKLINHLYSHMQGLKRYSGQLNAGLRVPERVAADRQAIETAHQDLTAELGREPNDDELADHIGFSHERLKRGRKAGDFLTTGFFSQMGESGSPYDPEIEGSQRHSDAWQRAIYSELSPTDKKVFELSTGFNGNRVLQNQQVAKRLRRSPGWVSQRKLVIQKMMDEAEGLNPF